MKTLIALALLTAGAVQAQTTVTLNPAVPQGLYVPVDITLDGPGVVRWNSTTVDSAYVTAGACAIDTVNVGFPGTVLRKVGFTCTTAGSVHLTTAGSATGSCPLTWVPTTSYTSLLPSTVFWCTTSRCARGLPRVS